MKLGRNRDKLSLGLVNYCHKKLVSPDKDLALITPSEFFHHVCQVRSK